MKQLSWALATLVLISQTAPGQSDGLKILVISGEGGVNDIRKGAGSRLAVEVRDRNDKPVHVVWGIPKGESRPAVLVTAYRPDPDLWDSDFKRRKP